MKQYLYRIFTLIAVSVSIIAGMTSCADSHKPDEGSRDNRTILVYLVANNSLSGYDSSDLDEMKAGMKAGALNDGDQLIVFHAPYNYVTNSALSPKLLRMEADGTLTTLEEYPDMTNSLLPESFSTVMSDMLRHAPASSYGLILWSHSTGWIGSRSSQSADTSAEPSRYHGRPLVYSWGEDNHLVCNIPDLAAILRPYQFDFIYFDSCFMGNMESIYELRGITPYIIATPTETPLDGMPYSKNLKPLFQGTLEGLVEAASNTYDFYNGKTGSDRSCCISVYDMSALDDVAATVRDILSAAAMRDVTVSDIQQYGFRTSWNNFDGYFYDLSRYVEALTPSAELLNRFTDAFNKLIVYNGTTPEMWDKFPLTDATGISVFPYFSSTNKGNINGYKSLAWYQDVVAPVAQQQTTSN